MRRALAFIVIALCAASAQAEPWSFELPPGYAEEPGATNGDIATLSGLTDEGHIMITPGRAPLIGKAANDAANGRAFQSVNIVETWTPVETVVSGDLAYQRGTYTVAATPKAGGNTTKTAGHFLRIYQRQPNGEWRMTHDTFNSVPASAPAK